MLIIGDTTIVNVSWDSVDTGSLMFTGFQFLADAMIGQCHVSWSYKQKNPDIYQVSSILTLMKRIRKLLNSIKKIFLIYVSTSGFSKKIKEKKEKKFNNV